MGKWFSKGLKRIISLTLGESDFGAASHKRGDLLFNEDCMEILEIDFDENKIPRPKVFKLNLQVTRFFQRINTRLGSIHSLYLVYSDEVGMFYESSGSQWHDRLKSILNEEYKLELEKIHFIRESDILNLYNSPAVRNRLKMDTDYIRSPYQLKPTEFLIVAGGFINFKYRRSPLMEELKGGITQPSQDEIIATIEVEFFKFIDRLKTEKIRMLGHYPVKYRPDSGAYFYIGGEWYHNLFIPEFFDPLNPRHICFRIDDDGKYIRFFPDTKIRHIPVCVKKPQKELGRDFIRLSYPINPDYISKPELMDIRMSIRYDSELEANITEIIDDQPETDETSLETLTWEKINREIGSREMPEPSQTPTTDSQKAEDSPGPSVDYDALPFLLSDMILLPKPGSPEEDVPAYIMRVGDDEDYIRIEISGIKNRISLFTSREKNPVMKKKLDEPIDFSTIIKGHEYSLSNNLMSRIKDNDIKLYFGWSLQSTRKEKIILESDYYIIGRDPVSTDPGHVIQLNKSQDQFWRIGSSRSHAFLMRGERGHSITNISAGNPIYILKPGDLNKTGIHPFRIEPVRGKRNLETCRSFLSEMQSGRVRDAMQLLPVFASDYLLENNDLVIIGNRIYLYVLPVVVESLLGGDIRNTLRTVQLKKNRQ